MSFKLSLHFKIIQSERKSGKCFSECQFKRQYLNLQPHWSKLLKTNYRRKSRNRLRGESSLVDGKQTNEIIKQINHQLIVKRSLHQLKGAHL